MERDQDSGASSRVSLAKYDPESSSWKMSQTLLFEDSDASLETFARSGTMRSGKLYPRKTPVRGTFDHVSSSSQRFATPTRKGNQLAPAMLLKHPGCAEAFRRFGKITAPLWEWMMGFPSGWTDFAPSATRSSRKSRSSSEEEPCESSNAAQ